MSSHVIGRAGSGSSIQRLGTLTLVALVTGATVFTGVMFTLVQSLSQRFGPQVEADLGWRALRGAQELSKTADVGLAVSDTAMVTESFGAYATSSDVQAIVAEDAQGKVVASHGQIASLAPVFAAKPGTLVEGDGYLASWAPAIIEGNNVGKVGVVVSTKRLGDAQAVLSRVSNATLIAGVTGAILGTLVIMFFTRQVSIRDSQLEDHTHNLEHLIAERTHELTLANHSLLAAAVEHERIENELRLAQKLESVGRLAAGIAHEINTPIQFVSDNIGFLREALPGLIDTIGKYRAVATTACAHGDFEAAVAAARAAEAEADIDYVLAKGPGALDDALHGLGRVAAIVRSMKEFAHPDRNEKTLVDLNRAVENTLMVAASECKYVADVRTELAPLPLVYCNAGEINQAVLNLVVNAAHAIRDLVGQTGAKGTITVCTRHDGSEVEIAIRDTGTGIPRAIRDKIYDPFFTTKEVGRGTGQGLAITRSVVVDKHGGSLRFHTQTGAGTTFFLRIPIGQALTQG